MGDTKQKWVLVVEDDAYINKAYAAKFGHEGIKAEFAIDGEEAMKQLKAADPLPSLIMLDLMLPKKNGFEVLTDIKATAGYKKIPVIILTNLGQETDAKRGLDMGADEYLVKADTKIGDIVTKINSYLA
jgi:two-component system alkaline phosphatase synthesis response regulator PhoP